MNSCSSSNGVKLISFLTLVLILLPHLLFVVFGFSSPSASLIALMLMMIPLILGTELRHFLKLRRDILYILLFLVACFAFHYMVAVICLGQITSKSIVSVISLSLILFYAILYLNIFRYYPSSVICLLVNRFVLLLLVLGWITVVFSGAIPIYSSMAHPVFPFSEPSHYALAVSLFLPMYFCQSNSRFRYFVIINYACLAMIFPNLTLLVVVLFSLICSTKVKLTSKLIFIVSLSVFVYFMLQAGFEFEYFGYIMSRISNLSSSSDNLSSLVYIQGWTDFITSLRETNGIGLGFQNMGVQPPSELADTIYTISGSYLNREDGGFVFAKLGTEFGALSIVLVIIIFFQNLYAIFRIKKMSRFQDGFNGFYSVDKLRIAIIISSSYLVEFLFRGYGYFTPNSVFFISIQLFIFSCCFVRLKSSSHIDD